MTKFESEKCEKACIEAIRNIEEATSFYKKAEGIDKEFHEATVELRKADNKQGYGEGIYQALVIIGYDSENMRKLSKLI